MLAVKGVRVVVGMLGIALFAGAGCKDHEGRGPDAETGGADAGAPGGAGGAAGRGVGGGAAGGAAGSAGDSGTDAGGNGGAPGPSWTELPPPPSEVAGLTVTDAWPAGPDDFFFSGSLPDPGADAGAASGPGWAVLRWTHGSWTVEMTQRTANPVSPRIAGLSPTDVWLTAKDTIYHRDAQGWSPQDDAWRASIAPIPLYGPAELMDVQPRTATEVWFAAGYAVLRLSDGQWQSWELTSGTPGAAASVTWFFERLWVSAANDVWAAGGSDEVGSTMDPAAMFHFDGTSWSIHGVGTFGVYDLWPAAAGEGQFWIALPVFASNSNPISLFDGSAASHATIAGWHGATEIVSLWGRSPTDIWGAGEDVAHYDGTTWTEASGTPDAVRDVNHLHSDGLVTGDETATWLVGRGPRFFRQAAPSAP